MTSQAKGKFVMTPILSGLIGVGSAVSPTQSRRIDQCQTQCVVVWLIGAVLAVRKYGQAKGAALVSEVEPLVRGYLELLWIIIATLDCADIPVVSRLRIRSSQREGGFERRFFGFPVDGVSEFHAIAGIPCCEADPLNKIGIFGLA